MSLHLSRFKISIILMALIACTGVLGYEIIEGMSFLDAVYMTVITLATVGYQEVKPLSDGGRIFTVGLILSGAMLAAYVVTASANIIFEGRLKSFYRRKSMKNRIMNLKNHHILAGYNRIGVQVGREFHSRKTDFVVIEKDAEKAEELMEKNFLVVTGDALEDEVLVEAGIKRAKTLITALTDDADNVYVTLTAKSLNPNVIVVAQTNSEMTARKLGRAGADKVILPYEIGGNMMALAAIRPHVTDLIELTTVRHELDLEIMGVQVESGSVLCRKTLADTRLSRELGLIVIAVKKGEETVFNPSFETLIEDKDILFVIGSEKQLRKLERLALKLDSDA